MPLLVRIIFGLIGLVLLTYVAILGINAFFDWAYPGGGSGRMARIVSGTIVGLAATLAVIVYRRFMR